MVVIIEQFFFWMVHQVYPLLLRRSPGGLSRLGDIAKSDVAVSSSSSRVHLPADDSFVPHMGSNRPRFVFLPLNDH